MCSSYHKVPVYVFTTETIIYYKESMNINLIYRWQYCSITNKQNKKKTITQNKNNK